MLRINREKITISYGDTFDVVFRLEGFELLENHKIYFTVKADLYDDNYILTKELTGLNGIDIPVVISSDDMKKIPIGINYYDLVCITADGTVITLTSPSQLIVEKQYMSNIVYLKTLINVTPFVTKKNAVPVNNVVNLELADNFMNLVHRAESAADRAEESAKALDKINSALIEKADSIIIDLKESNGALEYTSLDGSKHIVNIPNAISYRILGE